MTAGSRCCRHHQQRVPRGACTGPQIPSGSVRVRQNRPSGASDLPPQLLHRPAASLRPPHLTHTQPEVTGGGLQSKKHGAEREFKIKDLTFR
ncbi:uncharacterized protein V6R79_014664 [Siganus canaliculatus]